MTAGDGETIHVRLHSDDLAHLAELVVQGLATRPEGPSAANRLETAREVAVRFGVSASWVREHADELDARRLGAGSRPRLRFDPGVVARKLAGRSAGEESPSRNLRLSFTSAEVEGATAACPPLRGSGPPTSPGPDRKSATTKATRLGTSSALLPIRGAKTTNTTGRKGL